MGRCGKLAPIFYGPFEILEKKGPMEYELVLPSHVKVHKLFHASLLKKYVYDTKNVIDWSLLHAKPEGDFAPKTLHILYKREVQLKKHTIVQLELQWNHFEADEATWENEATMIEAYPALFHDFILSP